MLSRKPKRFIVFFTCLFIVYHTLGTLNERSREHHLHHAHGEILSDETLVQQQQQQQQRQDLEQLLEHHPLSSAEDHAEHLALQPVHKLQDSVPLPNLNEIHQLDQKESHDHTVLDLAGSDFYEHLFSIYMQHFPQLSPLSPKPKDSNNSPFQLVNMDDENSAVLSEEFLSERLNIDQQQFDELQKKHRSVVRELRLLKPPPSFCVANSEGIVIVADSLPRLLLTMLTIDTLRRQVHSRLGIEVFVKDPETQLCQQMAQQYSNVTCVPLLGRFSNQITSVWNFDDRRWYKNVALLSSSFHQIFYIDPTTVPLEDPQLLFEDQPFSTHGLVLWPDYWRRMTAPLYYKIVDKTLDIFRTRKGRDDSQSDPDTSGFFDKIPLHDRGGTIPDSTSLDEVLVIDKVKHFYTLLLSLYYTINGNDFYYPLLSNYAPNLGNSQKETFAALLTFLEMPYYQVKKSCQVAGSWFNKEFNGVGIKQYNAIRDHRNLVIYKRLGGDFQQRMMDDKVNRLQFVTLNHPQLEPLNLYNSFNSLRDVDGSQIRLLGEDLREIGYDVELRYFEVYKRVLCEEKWEFSYIENAKELCKFLNLHLTHLKSSSKDLKLA